MVSPKDKILRYYRGSELEETAIRCVDLAEQARKTRKFQVSPFLNEAEQELARTVAANYEDINVEFDGGYHGAERQRAIFVHPDFRGRLEGVAGILALRAQWKDSSRRVGHRDALGSLIGCGIDRSWAGDILVSENSARFILDQKVAEAVKNGLLYIGGVKVTAIEEDDLANIIPREERVKEIKATVASLRIDAVAAAGFGMSRTRAAEDIEAEKVQLNWQTVRNASQAVRQGDVISFRGRGRVEVESVGGQTKKNRTVVALKRYI